MLAAVLHRPGDLRLERVPRPQTGAGDLVLRVTAAAICGTDLRIIDGTKTKGVRYPVVLGHEIAGEIVETSVGVDQFVVGERVAVTPIDYCQRCCDCIEGRENQCGQGSILGYDYPGGFAQYVHLPAHMVMSGNVVTLPASVSDGAGSLLEPLACCLNGGELSGVRRGDSLLIMGCGPIGLMHLLLSQVAGAHPIIMADPDHTRRERAGSLGATVVVSNDRLQLESAVREATHGRGVQHAILATGAPAAADLALAQVRNGGSLNLFAGLANDGYLTLSGNRIHYGEIRVVGTSSSTRAHYHQALNLVEKGLVDLDKLVSHRFPLDRIAEAIDTVRSQQGLRVIVDPTVATS